MWTIRKTEIRREQIERLRRLTARSDFAGVVDYALAFTLANHDTTQLDDQIHGRFFQMSNKKLRHVVKIVQNDEPQVTRDEVWDCIDSDWNHAVGHQAWLYAANAHEIADWFVAGLEKGDFE